MTGKSIYWGLYNLEFEWNENRMSIWSRFANNMLLLLLLFLWCNSKETHRHVYRQSRQRYNVLHLHLTKIHVMDHQLKSENTGRCLEYMKIHTQRMLCVIASSNKGNGIISHKIIWKNIHVIQHLYAYAVGTWKREWDAEVLFVDILFQLDYDRVVRDTDNNENVPDKITDNWPLPNAKPKSNWSALLWSRHRETNGNCVAIKLENWLAKRTMRPN